MEVVEYLNKWTRFESDRATFDLDGKPNINEKTCPLDFAAEILVEETSTAPIAEDRAGNLQCGRPWPIDLHHLPIRRGRLHADAFDLLAPQQLGRNREFKNTI